MRASIGLMIASEFQAQGHLHLAVPVAAESARNNAEGRRSRGAARIREVRSVGKVVKLRPVFQPEALPDREQAKDGEVVIAQPRTANRIPARRPKAVWRRRRKRRRTKPRLAGADASQVSDRRDRIRELTVTGA